jgi:ATPase subunit of ABC transporter with duplicated ATPase domains
MDALAEQLRAGRLDVVDAHAQALDGWLARGGPDVDVRLDKAAAEAGLDPQHLDRPASQLSGGERARAMLAAITAAHSEVLLLDEPANHLDTDALQALADWPGALIVVTHDARLREGLRLDRVVEIGERQPAGPRPERAASRSTSAAPSRAIRERGTTRSNPADSAAVRTSASTWE